MKKLKIFLSVLLIFTITKCMNNVIAASQDTLISLGTGKYAITVNKTTTISDITGILGEPKLVTDSAFGGQAYTFYTDEDYSNYLYIETTKEGKIISYGSIDETYKTNTYSYGDGYPYTERSPLHGCLFSNAGTIEGGIYYNKSALYNSNYSLIIDFFESTYLSNQSKYLKGLSQQAVLMYNALSHKLGNTCSIKFDEDFFYINEQFKEFGTTIRKYIRDMGKETACMRGIGLKEDIEISNNVYYLLNPMQFASMAKYNVNISFDERNVAVFDYDYNNKLLTAITIRKDTFDKVDSVALTPEEQSKLSSGRYEYNQAIKNLTMESDIYDIIPVTNDASKLVAGKLKASKVQGITDYINAIRVAGGIPKLKASEEAFNIAQHISTLMTYRFTKLGLNIQHQPPKPDGVSDEYYNTAIAKNKAYSENLGYSATQTTEKTMRHYINLLLDDSSENPQLFSHRQKLLNSEYTQFGYGVSPYMFSNEFAGYKAPDTYLEAWPSNGITFMESLANKRFQWTAQFTDRYTILESTRATIKCLNTNQTWEFNEPERNSNRWFACYTKTTSSLNNKVLMYDSTILPQEGYVYEITIRGVKENSTNKIVDYKYRSAFEYADVNSYPTTLDKIEIKVPDNLVQVENEDVYYIPVGQEVKLSVLIDESVVDKKITWVSSNDMVTVTQNGTVYAKGLTDDNVTITATYDGSNVTSQIVLKPYTKLERIGIDKKEVTIYSSGNEKYGATYADLKIVQVPDDATEFTTVTWVVKSASNPDIEYNITDKEITEYIRVEVDKNNPKKVRVYAIDAEANNNKFYIIANIKGIQGDYTGTCTINVLVPVDYVSIAPTSSLLPISSHYMLIDYKKYKNTYFDLAANVYPRNTTDSKRVTWSVGDSSIVSTSDIYGRFNILKTGTTTITARGEHGDSDQITLQIKADLERIYLNKTETNRVKTIPIITMDGTTDTLKLTREPAINNDQIIFKSSDENVATVNNQGVVSFNSAGRVTITAYSASNPSIKDSYEYIAKAKISSINFLGSSVSSSIVKGEKHNRTLNVTPSVTGEYSYRDKIVYSSSDTSIATVDQKGNVVTKKNGQVTITATINRQYTVSGKDLSTSYVLNVISPLKGVSAIDRATVSIGQTKTFSIQKDPIDTTDSVRVEWSSSNPNVLQVVDKGTGVTKARQKGTAIITAKVFRNNTLYQTLTIDVNVVDYLKGDMNLDGKVNATDAAIVLDRYKYKNATEMDYAIGDMNDDGKINSTDAALILDVYKNKTK